MTLPDDSSEGIAGRYRTFGEEVSVKDEVTGKIYHEGVKGTAVQENMDGLLETYNDMSEDNRVSRLVLLAGFHKCFEQIHPFNDGNGRIGRLLVNFELIKHGYLPIDIKFADRAAYYDAFDEPDNCDAMAELFTRSMLNSTAMYRRLHKQYQKGDKDKLPIYQVDTVSMPNYEIRFNSVDDSLNLPESDSAEEQATPTF
jgi:Fic family protein